MSAPAYPPILQVIPFLPVAIIIAFYASQDQGPAPLFGLLLLLVSIALIVTYIRQLKYLKTVLKRKMASQERLIMAGAIFPALGAVAGDIYGGLAFGSNASASIEPGAIPILAIVLGLIVMDLCAIGNVIAISWHGTKQMLQTLARVGAVLLWIAIVGVSYFLAMLTYSLRDPSTE